MHYIDQNCRYASSPHCMPIVANNDILLDRCSPPAHVDDVKRLISYPKTRGIYHIPGRSRNGPAIAAIPSCAFEKRSRCPSARACMFLNFNELLPLPLIQLRGLQIKPIEGDLLTDIIFYHRGLLTANKVGHAKLWVRPLAVHPRHLKSRTNRSNSIADVDVLG